MKIKIERFTRPTRNYPYGELEVSFGDGEHYVVKTDLGLTARAGEMFEHKVDMWVEEAQRQIKKHLVSKMEITL